MKKIYKKIIIVLVLVVSLVSISLMSNINDEKNQGTKLDADTQDFDNMGIENININNQNNMNNNNQQILEKIEQENGLVIEILKNGDGEIAENGKTVAVHYIGKLEDGTIFDSSIERGTPIEFQLGAGMVIQGWELGILGMKVGEKRILTIPAELGYGMRGVGSIPGGATLIFEVELISVK